MAEASTSCQVRWGHEPPPLSAAFSATHLLASLLATAPHLARCPGEMNTLANGRGGCVRRHHPHFVKVGRVDQRLRRAARAALKKWACSPVLPLRLRPRRPHVQLPIWADNVLIITQGDNYTRRCVHQPLVSHLVAL